MLDLSLARTYVPVCLCAGKTGALCALLSVLRAAGTPGFNAYVLLGVLLFVDRVSQREFIFNTNTIVSFVLFSVVFDDERRAHARPGERRVLLGWVLNALWAALGFAALLRVQDRFSVFRYVAFRPLLAAAALLVVHSFVAPPPEPEAWTFVRVFDFITLSIAWIYFVNVERVSAHTVYDCTDCLVFFGHVLFTALPVAAAATAASCAALAVLRAAPPVPDEEMGAPCSEEGSDGDAAAEPPLEPPDDPDQAALEALFHEAKARVGGAYDPVRARLRVVP